MQLRRGRGLRGKIRVIRKMAPHLAVLNCAELRCYRLADFLPVRTAGVKAASAGRIDRARHIIRKHDAPI